MSLVENQISALREVDEVWPGVSAVIIGATALGFYFDMRWRQTADVDLVVALTLDEFPDLGARSGWRRHAKREHEFVSPSGAKLDLLPAGARLLQEGRLQWRDGSVMSLEGMDLAFEHAEPHVVQGYRVLVAPPPVIAILKMVSFGERPAERERDLEDIAHLLDAYVDESSGRRWDDAAECGEFDLAPAYLLGLDIHRLLASDVHRAIVSGFLRQIESPESTSHLLMSSLGPERWRTEENPLARRIDAFRAGMKRGRGA